MGREEGEESRHSGSAGHLVLVETAVALRKNVGWHVEGQCRLPEDGEERSRQWLVEVEKRMSKSVLCIYKKF